MPSDQSTWLISAPLTGDSEGIEQELTFKLSQQSKSFSPSNLGQFSIPSFKVCLVFLSIAAVHRIQTGTLDLLVSLSEDLPKQDAFFTATVAKIVDTLRNLLNNDPAKLAQHILVNEKSVDDYVLKDWKWNEGRYGMQRGPREMIDTLNKVCVYTLNIYRFPDP
jgi:V-type H+-transporting ATPase subunit C